MNKPTCPSGRLHADIVKRNLANTKQIVLEVTDACNLRCKYCGLGDMYTDHDKRGNNNLNANKAIRLIEYIFQWIDTPFNMSLNKSLYIGFYGGEPLLNIDIVKQVVTYIKNKTGIQRQINFNMTTNAVLLDKHMEYLATNDFSLLISLDGGQEHHSYRVFPNNHKQSDHLLAENIILI